jgi:hypothetical protein
MALTTRADQYLQLGRNCRLMAQASARPCLATAPIAGRMHQAPYGFRAANKLYAKTLPKLPFKSATNSMLVHMQNAYAP